MIGKIKLVTARQEPCLHNTGVDVYCTHNFLEDTGRYTADIRIVCSACLTPFRFLGLPYGLDLTGAAGKEPPPPIDGIQGFTIKKL